MHKAWSLLHARRIISHTQPARKVPHPRHWQIWKAADAKMSAKRSSVVSLPLDKSVKLYLIPFPAFTSLPHLSNLPQDNFVTLLPPKMAADFLAALFETALRFFRDHGWGLGWERVR